MTDDLEQELENQFGQTIDVEFDPETEVNDLEDKMRALNYTVTKYISMYDVKRTGLVWNKLTDKQKKDLLWEAGLDVRHYRYITHKDAHITLEGLRKECVRFICEERSDKKWIDTGLASDDAYLKYKNDPSFTRNIKQMENCYLNWDHQVSALKE
jgi:hypothetical protein